MKETNEQWQARIDALCPQEMNTGNEPRCVYTPRPESDAGVIHFHRQIVKR